MPSQTGFSTLEAPRRQLDGRWLDAQADLADERDYTYPPPLISLAAAVDPRGAPWWSPSRIRNQGGEPSCTGHALAAIIDHLRARDLLNGRAQRTQAEIVEVQAAIPSFHKPWASWRMLYGVARFHDEWLGEHYGGSSIRGALKGFYYNGVCSIGAEPVGLMKKADDKAFRWHMTREVLESARGTQLGAYYRVRPRLADLHAALNESGLILASADLHQGWRSDRLERSKNGDVPRIPFDRFLPNEGRHAFVIVGYDANGLLIQNSWGEGWGSGGLARWCYEDWSANVIDLWVLRIAATFGESRDPVARPQFARNRAAEGARPFFEKGASAGPSRLDVIGHMAKFEEGRLETRGHFHADRETLKETFRLIRDRKDDKGFRYRHVLVHFTGAKRNEEIAASALRDALPVFKENGVYPIFVLPEASVAAEFHSLCARVVAEVNGTHGLRSMDPKDALIEGRLAETAYRLRRVIEDCGRHSFRRTIARGDSCALVKGDASDIFNMLFRELEDRWKTGTISFHLSAHGAGAHFIAGLCDSAELFESRPLISSLTLIAPMIAASGLEPVLGCLSRRRDPVNRRAKRERLEIERLALACLGKKADAKDVFAPGYSYSWPRLWSHVYERARRRSPNDETPAPADEALSRPADGEQARETVMKPDVSRLLALDEHLTPFAEAIGAEFNVLLKRFEDAEALGLSHETLENRAPILDWHLEQILGRAGKPSFAAYYGTKNGGAYV